MAAASDEPRMHQAPVVQKTSSDHIGMDDFVVRGAYVWRVCILAQLMILTQVGNMFYMIYAGSPPLVTGCGNTTYSGVTDKKELCQLFHADEASSHCAPIYQSQFYSVNEHWSLFCEAGRAVKRSISLQMLGVLTGAFVFGQLSDTYGRKPAMIGSLLCACVVGIAVAFAPSLEAFTVLRFIVGAMCGGQVSMLNVYIIENVSKADRLWINMIVGWAPNMGVYAGIAYLFADWRQLTVVTALLQIPGALYLAFFLFESPRWTLQKGRTDEAKRILREIVRIGGHDHLERHIDEVVDRETEVVLSRNVNRTKYTYYHLFYTWTLAARTLACAFSYASTSIINYGIMFNMEALTGSIYINNTLSGIMRYIPSILIALIDVRCSWLGRKTVHTLSLAVICACLGIVITAYALDLSVSWALTLRLSILFGCATTSQVYIANGVIGNEVFPTVVRNLGYSFLQVSNRFGVVLSPFTFYLEDLHASAPYVVMCALGAIDALIFHLVVPETKGASLVDRMPSEEERIRCFGGRKRRNSHLLPTNSSSTLPPLLVAQDKQ